MKEHFNLETALATWRHQYTYSRAFKGRDLDELEQHLRDQVAFLMDAGQTEEAAFRKAVAELGGFHETESNFRAVALMKTRDRREVIQEIKHQGSMLTSYFRVALRNLKKNRATSLINIVNLSMAIAVTLVTFLTLSSFLTEDYFHENADEIFLVHRITRVDDTGSGVAMGSGAAEGNGAAEGSAEPHITPIPVPHPDVTGFQWWGSTPPPLGPAIASSSPSVVRAVRVDLTRGQVLKNDDQLGLNISFVDEGFLDMFTFPLAAGTSSALRNPGEILLSAEQAERFFGQENPVGRSLSIRMGDLPAQEFTVTGVARPFPSNTDFKFSALMPWSVADGLRNSTSDSWSALTAATFVQLTNRDQAPRVEADLASYVPQVNAGPPESRIEAFGLDNLKRLTRNSKYVQESIAGTVPWAAVVVLGGLSALLLLLACFNYMNLTIAQATRRMREIGVRKVIGARRGQVAFQFLAENLVLCSIALVVGLWMAWQFLLPAFNSIASLNLQFALLSDWRLWIFLGVLVLGTGFVSGLYPAVYVSSFEPTIIFRGLGRLRRRRPVTTAFQGFQFVLAFLSLAAGASLVLNSQYFANRSAGYDTDRIIVFQGNTQAQMDVLGSAAGESPQVDSWTTSLNAFGSSWHEFDARIEGREFSADVFGVSPDFPGLMDVQLVAGRSWAPSPEDRGVVPGPESILVNETFVQTVLSGDADDDLEAGDVMGFVGRTVQLDSMDYTVAGVLEDFHYEDFFAVIQPAVLRLVPVQEHRFVIVRTEPGQRGLAASQIASHFEKAFDGQKADYFFQDYLFTEFRNESSGLTAIFLLVSVFSLIISCLSIYALSAQNILNRIKEVGVRKVLGGQAFGIAQRLNRGILLVLTVAALVSAPVGFRVLAMLLDSMFAYHMELTARPFVLAFAVIAAASLLTISIQVRAIHRAQPARILGSE